MFYKFLISAILLLFVASCATKPKDAADASGSGSSTSDSSVSTIENMNTKMFCLSLTVNKKTELFFFTILITV